MMRTSCVVMGGVIALGCWSCKSSSSKKAAKQKPATPVAASVDAAPAPVTLAPLNTKPVPDKWWLDPAKHCPSGHTLAGSAPPKGTGVWCWDAKRKRTGPRTGFHKNGSKSSEGWEKDSKSVGVWTYWYANGNKRWTVSIRDDGRRDGVYKRWASDGKLIGEYTLKDGNGTATHWNDNGLKYESGPMKHGLRDGTWTSFHDNGAKSATSIYRGDKQHGPTTAWDKQGRKLTEGSYANGRFDGRWTYYDADKGAIKRVDVYKNKRQERTIYYQDGKPLGIDPPDTCMTDDEVSEAVKAVTGRGLSKRHRCIRRSRAFPGVVIIGSFANDRGCMPIGMVVDCKFAKAAASSKSVLARAGWKRANAANRQAIAVRYLRQVVTAFRGRIPWDKKLLTFKANPDGGLVVGAWVKRPSGMVKGWTRDLFEYTFTGAGDMTRTLVKTESGGR